MKIPRPLHEAANADHSNVYFIMLLLSEGRTEEGRAVYSKVLLFIPSEIKCQSLTPWVSPSSDFLQFRRRYVLIYWRK